MKRFYVAVALAACFWLAYYQFYHKAEEAPAASALLLWDLARAQETSLAEVLPDLAAPGLIYVGESHDSRAHHAMQLSLIRALHEAGSPVAVGLEMLRHAHQPYLDDWVAGRLPERRMRDIFVQDWGFAWELYRPIFVYCREEGLPMAALNVPRAITRKVAREGFLSLTREELGQLPPISCNVDPEYEAFLRRVLGEHAHGGGQGPAFRRFCEAQLVWDTAMAIYALEFLEKHPEKSLVVLTGTVHAWKLAMPTQAARLGPGLRQRVLLPFVAGRLTPQTLDARDADYLVYP